NLRKQAKFLYKSLQANEPQAIARLQEFHPRPDRALQSISLHASQLIIARSYGFASWPKLKRHLDEVKQHFWQVPQEPEGPEPDADRFMRLACLTYLDDRPRRREQAREMLAANLSIAHANIYAASTAGDVATVRAMLAENPSLANLKGGPNHWEPLLYVAYSRLNSEAAGHSTLAVARLLLAHGADPNTGFLWDGRYVFTALTGAFGEGESGPIHQPEHQYCYPLAKLLLEAGADPNDSQTLYNRMFTG